MAGKGMPGVMARAKASATKFGTVKKAAARADNATAIPANAPAGGVGAAAGAYDTAVNRDAMIATVNGLVAFATALKAEHNDLLAKLRTAGILS